MDDRYFDRRCNRPSSFVTSSRIKHEHRNNHLRRPRQNPSRATPPPAGRPSPSSTLTPSPRCPRTTTGCTWRMRSPQSYGFPRRVAHGMFSLEHYFPAHRHAVARPRLAVGLRRPSIRRRRFVGTNSEATVTVQQVSKAAQLVVLTTEVAKVESGAVVFRGTAKVRVAQRKRPHRPSLEIQMSTLIRSPNHWKRKSASRQAMMHNDVQALDETDFTRPSVHRPFGANSQQSRRPRCPPSASTPTGTAEPLDRANSNASRLRSRLRVDAHGRLPMRATPIDQHLRYTRVWSISSNGSLQIVAGHMSEVPTGLTYL